MECMISKQIAKHCDEPEVAECPVCFSSMTETNGATSHWLQCDKCDYQTSEINEARQYEIDANADYLTEQIPNV